MSTAFRVSSLAVLSALWVAGLSSAAAAQGLNSSVPGTSTARIDAREANQERRIYQGVQNGSLTPREYRRLERREGRIDGAEALAKSDGVVTPSERARLNGMLNRESRAIYRQRHDGQRVGWR